MGYDNKSYGHIFAMIFFVMFFLFIFCFAGTSTVDCWDKYDYHHGYNAHKKVSDAHAAKWVEKHWTGSKRNYKYYCECIYYDPEHGYTNVCSLKQFKKYYKACYDDYGRNIKGWDYSDWKRGYATWLGG